MSPALIGPTTMEMARADCTIPLARASCWRGTRVVIAAENAGVWNDVAPPMAITKG